VSYKILIEGSCHLKLQHYGTCNFFGKNINIPKPNPRGDTEGKNTWNYEEKINLKKVKILELKKKFEADLGHHKN
jgi:hypothetical protein